MGHPGRSHQLATRKARRKDAKAVADATRGSASEAGREDVGVEAWVSTRGALGVDEADRLGGAIATVAGIA